VRVEAGLPAKEREGAQKLIAAIQEQLKYTTEQKNAAAAGSTVRQELDRPAQEAQDKELLTTTIKGVTESAKEARTQRDNINSAHRMRALLDSRAGVVTGIWSKDRLLALRIMNFIGVPNADRIAGSEAFNSETSRQILGMANALPGVLSDKDVLFLEKIAGSSDLNEASIRQLLDISERVARAKIAQHNEQVGAAAAAFPAMGKTQNYHTVEEPGEYRKPARQLKENDIIRDPQTNKRQQVKGGRLVDID